MCRVGRIAQKPTTGRRGRKPSYAAYLLVAGLSACGLAAVLAQAPVAPPAEPEPAATLGTPRPLGPDPAERTAQADALQNLLGPDTVLIDLPSTLRAAGVNNPQILIARQRVLEAVALRQRAAAGFLPNLNLGTSYDDHNGNLQQSSGNILKVDRESFYVGTGANAVGAGTVTIPGVAWNKNVSEALYTALIACTVVKQRQFENRAVENEMLRRVAGAYTELLRGEGAYAISRKVFSEAAEVERVTTAFAKAGQGRQADADRAATERRQRQTEMLAADGDVLTASARLAELLSMPPTARLHVADAFVVPCPVVPDPIPLPELLSIAILNRPELAARNTVIREALLALHGARLLPFSPNVILGLSYGNEGGGSNLVAQPVGTSPFAAGAPRFSELTGRLDFDAVAYWSLQNLGVGNKALIDAARGRLSAANYQYLEQLNRVRFEVANAYARTHAHFAQIDAGEQAVRDATVSYESDSKTVAAGVGRPIELLESLRLLARARYLYLNAIIDYNQAQIDLYVALGQPPADTLARPVPPAYVPPAPEPPARKAS